MIVCGDRFSMHMVDPWVLKGHAIKLLTFHIKGTLLSASMDSGCHGCFAAQNLTEWINKGK